VLGNVLVNTAFSPSMVMVPGRTLGYTGTGICRRVRALSTPAGLPPAFDYVILQCKHIISSSNTNVKDLSDELCLLHKAQYFMDSFYKRALAHNVKGLPCKHD